MATTVKQQEYLAKQEYIIDRHGKRHCIYPMLIEKLADVTELFSKINMEFIILNMPMQALDDQGNQIFDEDGEAIIDTTAYDAMNELLEMCFADNIENIGKWLDIGMIQDSLDSYQLLSGLKKQAAMETQVHPSES